MSILIGILITWLVLVGLALYALAIPYLELYRPVSIQYAAAEPVGR